MIGIIAPVRGQIEGHRKPLLSRRKISPVKGIGIFSGGEPRILPDGPRLRRVHRGVGATQKRRLARLGLHKVRCVFNRIDGLDRNSLGTHPCPLRDFVIPAQTGIRKIALRRLVAGSGLAPG